MIEQFVRAPSARVFERNSSLFLLDPRGTLRRLDGDSAALARAVLDLLGVALTREELFASLAELVGGPVEPASVVDELLGLLRQCGAVTAVRRSATSSAGRVAGPSGLRVVLGVTGAVQSIHTPTLAALLLAEGHDVRAVMTANAQRFCRPEGIEALTHNPVCTDLWDAAPYGVAPHIRLAEWAELVLIAPASATTIARIAGGSCDDPVSAVAIATRAPVVVAPSMNAAMIEAPSVRRNLDHLRDDGVILVQPTSGHEVALAPRERGAMRGTMAPPHELVAILRAIISTAPARREPSSPELSSWNARYEARPDTRPWESDALDDGLTDTLARALTAIPSKPARALDLGCGSGLVASHLAQLGCDVTAVDAAERALAVGAQRAAGDRVRWLCGDALTITLDGRFDLAHDRALLHVLPPTLQRAYAARVASWLAPKGVFVLTAHSEETPAELGTTRMSVRAVAELFDGLLSVTNVSSCAMRGPSDTAIPARRYVLAR